MPSVARSLPPPQQPALPLDVERSVRLEVVVTDPEVVAELRRFEGSDRDRYALAALRVGVLSLRMAGGQIDATAVREAGQQMLLQLRQLLESRGEAMAQGLAQELKAWFDPSQGALPQRLRALVEPGGELERMLSSHVSGDESSLAKTLVAHLGEDSGIFRMLSPTDANGLRMQVAATLQQALADQREQVLREFSLDRKESALARLVDEIRTRQTELGADMKGQIAAVVTEFSLDKDDSALSRLVRRVEVAQKTIADQFSLDDDRSAISKLSKLLQDTNQQIGRQLTLDDDQSALYRLRRELMTTLEGLERGNQSFHAEVKATLAALQARRDEAEQSTRHGVTFEQALADVLFAEAQRAGDVPEAVGNKVGTIKNNKKGDVVVTLGAESPAPGVSIVWEAKEDQSYDLKKALAELDEAKKNRSAQVGVFVFSRKTAAPALAPFARHGRDIIVVWDATDAATDVLLKAAYSLARALVVRESRASDDATLALAAIERATRSIEKQVGYLAEIQTSASTMHSGAKKILERAERMQADLKREVDQLDAQLRALKVGPAA